MSSSSSSSSSPFSLPSHTQHVSIVPVPSTLFLSPLYLPIVWRCFVPPRESSRSSHRPHAFVGSRARVLSKCCKAIPFKW